MNLPPGARLHNDGRISFPYKGDAPTHVAPGYHVDPDDDYIWIKDYDPCKHRQIDANIKCPVSGKYRLCDYCVLLKLKINPSVCSVCDKKET